MQTRSEKWQSLLTTIQSPDSRLSALIGFDGFIDKLVRVIESSDEDKRVTYFEKMKDFTDYTSRKSGSNFSMELEEKTSKMGGNAPITAHALCRLGVNVTAIGAFGYPALAPQFDSLTAGATTLSFANPGTSTALEFKDGKIILGEMHELNEAGWEDVIARVGKELIQREAEKASLMCFLNWSELRKATAIWKGMLSDIIPLLTRNDTRTAFIDLADFSRKSYSAVHEIVDFIRELNKKIPVVLGLNFNEARSLYTLFTTSALQGIEETGRLIFDSIKPSALIIHYSIHAYGWDEAQHYHCETIPIDSPLITTGAGDNFNAGVCLGLLHRQDLNICMQLGHAAAYNYMTTGRSPDIHELFKTLLILHRP